ncbi:MAG: hypothetical protein HPY69_09535 [Armatimonadetes bacterium]|nr:hypothetical protein [Armatimonadota bacterium]
MWTELLMPMLVLAVVLGVPAGAQLDRERLVAAFRDWDAGQKEGRGLSESADSGTLGWGEASYLRNYMRLWAVTGDTYWLSKVQDHFTRMIGNARDHDGDRFVGWQTTTYSCGLFYAQALHNISKATIEPAERRETRGEVAAKYTGHTYIIEFTDPATYRVQDQNTRQYVAEGKPYASGEPIGEIPGLSVTVTGETHQGDKFLVRTIAPEPTEFAVHEGMVAYPVALFVEAIRKDPGLQAQFGKSADQFLAYIAENMLRKHEQHWLDMGDGAGGYRFADLITDRFPNRLQPHNQYLALGRAYLVLKDVPGADPLFATRAEQMARLFRRYLREQGEAWVWNYWDWVEGGEPGHSGLEDTSHGTIDVGFAIEACHRGVVFTAEDMKRFARTVLDQMWNGSTEDPKLGPNVGTRGDRFAMTTSDWFDLGEWEPQIWRLALTAFSKAGQPTASAPAMLAAEKAFGGVQ